MKCSFVNMLSKDCFMVYSNCHPNIQCKLSPSTVLSIICSILKCNIFFIFTISHDMMTNSIWGIINKIK